MKNESKLKKIFKKSVLTVLALGAIAGATAGAAAIKDSSLPTNEDMMFLAESIDADMSFSLQDWRGNYRVLPHNNGKPIYISISDELLNSEYGQIIKDNIDSVFSVVGRINPLYKYEIVSESDIFAHKLLMQSVIQIKNEDLSKVVENDDINADGLIRTNSNILNFVSTRNERSNLTISIDLENLKNKENVVNAISYTLRHEFGHAFGLDDTYSATKAKNGQQHLENIRTEYYNTLMQSGYNRDNFLNNYTPYDFRRFVTTMHEKGTAKDVERYEKLCEDYKKEYYQQLENFILEKEDIAYPENVKECARLVSYTSYCAEDDGKDEVIYDVKIDGDKYIYKLTRNGELVGSCEGKVLHGNNMSFLLNVNVPFLTPSDSQGFIGDLVLINNGGAYSCYSPELNNGYYFDDIEMVKTPEVEFGY